jgi:hypothetical protein
MSTNNSSRTLAIVSLALACVAAPAFADKPPGRWMARNLRVLGYSETEGRPGFKLAIQQVSGRWLLYMGHLWDRGWTIMDVTNPRDPRVVRFVPGPANTWTIQMDVEEGKMITALERIAPGWGGDPAKPFDEGVIIWSLADPLNPQPLGQFRTHGTGTHRDGYFGGKYVHLAAGMPGYSGNIYVIIDISNPKNPVEAGRWWVPGQWVAGGEKPTVGVSLHGPPYVQGNLAYVPFGAAGLVILDVSDPAHIKKMGQLSFTPPFLGNIGAHSALPLPSRNLAIVNSEAIREDCNEPLNHASVVDVSNPATPTLLALLPLPVPPPGLPYSDFCHKGGRFGPHNVNHHHHSPFTDHSDTLVYLTYFNAGLRIYDISDATQPKEVAWFVPPDPVHRYGPLPTGSLVAQTEDVLVDTRGYIYVTHKNQGLWILKYEPDPDGEHDEGSD